MISRCDKCKANRPHKKETLDRIFNGVMFTENWLICKKCGTKKPLSEHYAEQPEHPAFYYDPISTRKFYEQQT